MGGKGLLGEECEEGIFCIMVVMWVTLACVR